MEALLISQKEGVHASMGIGESAFMSPEGGFVHPIWMVYCVVGRFSSVSQFPNN